VIELRPKTSVPPCGVWLEDEMQDVQVIFARLLRHEIKPEGLFINILIPITELTTDIAIITYVADNNLSFQMRLFPIIKDKINHQLIPNRNVLSAVMPEAKAAQGNIDNPAVAGHFADIRSICPIDHLAEKALKICLFAIPFPEIKINGEHLPANAFYLQRVLLIFKLGHGYMFHRPAMGTVEQGHIFLIDKNFSLSHAKKTPLSSK
jgi:hypothetical protein